MLKRLHTEILMFVLVLASCATSQTDDSLKLQSDGREWTAMPMQMPRGERSVILVPARPLPALTSGKRGMASETEAKKAAEAYVVQQRLACNVGDAKEMDSGGWLIKLACQ